jgi:hypothetical protein
LIAQHNKPGQGIALTVLMAACFASMDTSIKVIGAVMPVLFVLWARYGIQTVLMATWLSRGAKATAGATWLPRQPRFQLMRGALTPAQHDQQIAAVRSALGKLDQPHWQEFLARWAA